MEKLNRFTKKYQTYLIAGATSFLLTILFYTLVNILWNSITKFYAEQSNEQIITALSKDISEGNYFGFISTLGKIKMNRTLNEFGIIEKLNGFPKKWLYVSSESLKLQQLQYYTCSDTIKLINQHGSTLLITSSIPSVNITQSDSCLVLEFQLPATLIMLKNTFYFLFGAVVFIILVGQLFYLSTLKRKAFEIEKNQLESEMKLLSQISILAKQVSHDIRSPLAALNMLVNELEQVPEVKRIIIRNSVQRINDIANDLLVKGKQQDMLSEVISKNFPIANLENHKIQHQSVELLYPIIDSIVSEKRLQFRHKHGVEIGVNLLNAYGLFAKINSIELMRVISNLLTNAVEALPEDSGKVNISLHSFGNEVVITITDTGKGIPPHILAKLGQIGVTHGKSNSQSGCGLGVYHAMATIENIGGKFKIESREQIGTIITISLPKVPAPEWFVEKLLFEVDSQIISIDDEITIHQIWQSRFKYLNMESKNIKHISFTSGDEFKSWYFRSESRNDFGKRIYLVDYEMLNQKQNGLEIIGELGIGKQSILVTSRFEESAIREKCENLGVRLIPKPMSGFVPIEINNNIIEYYDAILIDDDNLVELSWQMIANERNKKFLYFSNPDDFFRKSQNFHFECPIYVDSNLGHNIRGEDISKQIYELGFKNVNLCTGYHVSDFPQMSWVRSIVGKEPIF